MNILRKTLCLSLLILFTTCKNDDDTPPIEQLPEATQTGRGIFGCLVDGEAFVETGTFFNTFYQFVDGEFFFSIQGEFDSENPRSITINTNGIPISQGGTLQLIDDESGSPTGLGFFTLEEENNFALATTSISNPGTLTITKLDFESNIVSGTFEMTLTHPFTGDEVQITEGRFDTLFTQ